MTSRLPWRMIFAIALLMQMWALYWPRPPSVDAGLPLDKVVHFALFAAVTYAGVLAGLDRRLVGLLMLAQAVLSEAIQHVWLAQRGGDVWDLVADVAGIAVALWASRPGSVTADPHQEA